MAEIFDKFHYHELSDRCHIVNSMIGDFIAGHPATSHQMRAWCEEAQRKLCSVMSAACEEETRLEDAELEQK